MLFRSHEIHAEHINAIESKLTRPSIRLSEALKNPDLIEGKDCLIIDSFGLLSSIYRYSDVAYIGGGFGTGIHNTLEAAVYGIPVLFGPKFQKFKEARDLIAAGAAFSVTSGDEFVTKMNELFSYPDLLTAVGKSAGDFVAERTGVTDKILKQLNL